MDELYTLIASAVVIAVGIVGTFLMALCYCLIFIAAFLLPVLPIIAIIFAIAWAVSWFI